MRILSTIFILFIILIGVTFACLNAEVVNINYYVGSSQMPLSMLLAISFIAGGLFGLIVALKMFFRVKRENYQLQKKIKIAAKEIENLRVIPVKGNH